MDPIFSMLALHTRTYPPCNSQSMGMQSLATLVCQIWVNYMWNMKIARQSVLFWRGSIKRLGFQTTNRYSAETFMISSYRIGLPYFAGTSYEHMRVSQFQTSNWKFLKYLYISDLLRSRVSREPVGLWTPHFLCLLYIYVPTQPVTNKAQACTA